MKKSTVIQLIRCHVQHNDPGFRQAATEVAHAFEKAGDTELALYVAGLIAKDGFAPPDIEEVPLLPEPFFEKLTPSNASLILPEVLVEDIEGILRAITRRRGLHRFLLEGAPGTGKTETVRHLGRLLRRDIYLVNFTQIVDCRLGASQRNLAAVFDTLEHVPRPERILVFFDELDALAADRCNARDHREMGRLTSAMLTHLDKVRPEILLFAATNLFEKLDPALKRRFDAVIRFDRYKPGDVQAAADHILEEALTTYGIPGRNKKLFPKILDLLPRPLMPGELLPLIRRATAFSDDTIKLDYLRRLYLAVTAARPLSTVELRAAGFTEREVESLTGTSKEQASPILATES